MYLTPIILKNRIELDCSAIDKFSNIIDVDKYDIPQEVCRIASNSILINDELSAAFLGYQAMSDEEITSQYGSRDRKVGFFGAYDADDKFHVGNGQYILLQEDLNGELEEPEKIENLSRFIPLFKYQGDYIVIDLKKNHHGELIIITDGYIGTILAPSIMAHLDDLVGGLREGNYRVDVEEIIFPSSWYQRKGVRSGKYEMDEDGEIV